MTPDRFPYNTIWAFLSVDEAGNEGIMAVGDPQFGSMPLVTGCLKNLEHMKMIVKNNEKDILAQGQGKKIVLAEFSRAKTEAFI